MLDPAQQSRTWNPQQSGRLSFISMCLSDRPLHQFTLDFPQERVAADINGDGFVDFADLLLLLAAWGPCE